MKYVLIGIIALSLLGCVQHKVKCVEYDESGIHCKAEELIFIQRKR